MIVEYQNKNLQYGRGQGGQCPWSPNTFSIWGAYLKLSER